jgi:transposase-like protein
MREIQGYLREMYALEVSPEFIRQVTEAVMAEVLEWQSRRSSACLRWCSSTAFEWKIRDEGVVRNKAPCYVKVQANQEFEVLSTRGGSLRSLQRQSPLC